MIGDSKSLSFLYDQPKHLQSLVNFGHQTLIHTSGLTVFVIQRRRRAGVATALSCRLDYYLVGALPAGTSSHLATFFHYITIRRKGSTIEANDYYELSCQHSSGRFPCHHALIDIIQCGLISAKVSCTLAPSGLNHAEGTQRIYQGRVCAQRDKLKAPKRSIKQTNAIRQPQPPLFSFSHLTRYIIAYAKANGAWPRHVRLVFLVSGVRHGRNIGSSRGTLRAPLIDTLAK
ncbi:hypothetical protein EVAR_52585_1 [Eumeta japonica]|uniref:Uncharacterized protein n=1 Tax=Eumeta variegata TaxID=151549 RepID=A0A4C1SM11_EUMVA|nr:hypothetical protein EVAR_52585_1 [Eumeta japonica]